MSGVEAVLAPEREAPPVGRFEFLPGWAFYTPVVAYWIALGVRYGDWSLPTIANPTIEQGGLCGESKTSILDQVTGTARNWLARYVCVAGPDLADAEAARQRAGIDYPLVAKPDIGCNGTGVRLVADRAALADYLAEFPRDAAVVLQEYVRHPCEAGLFYIRYPGEKRGRVTSVTLKQEPNVCGDGRSTVQQLVLADPRLNAIRHFFIPRLGARLAEVPGRGQTVSLLFVGNHCKGSTFRDGRDEITDALAARIDEVAQATPEFHFGRFDVRYDSLAALRRGEGFSIIEINGVGSEATHVWDPTARLLPSWRDQFFHYRAAFEIGRVNRARGFRTRGSFAMLHAWRRQRRLMASYPQHD
ncbi:MAG: D-alanine--D-alanine ligase [Acidisphaera sp.]|nr:D-alanine--D-alanine ligase [Acidisphaera sp.]MBV9812734.1 D-alanine--D-alanine ligase [Acetobacteraceae bacterium]